MVVYGSPECIGYAELEQAWKYMTICCIKLIHAESLGNKGQGSRRVKIDPVAEIYDFLICCRIIYLMKKNVITPSAKRSFNGVYCFQHV